MSESEPNSNRREFPWPLGWLVRHPRTTISLSILLLVLLGLSLTNRGLENRLKRKIAEIKSRGEPVSIADVQAATPEIPPDENMAVQLLKHTASITAYKFPEGMSEALPIAGTAYPLPMTGQRHPAHQVAAARQYVSSFSEELQGIRDALKLERGSAVVVWKTPPIATLRPELAEFRATAKLLVLDALVAAEDGDRQRAARALKDAYRLQQAMGSEPFIIGALVQTAILALAQDQTERTINLCGLHADALRDLQSTLKALERRPNYKAAFLQERASFIDTIQWARSGNIAALSSVVASPNPVFPLWKWIPALPALDAIHGIEVYTAMVDAIGAPDAATLQRIKAAENRVLSLPKYYVLSRIMIPSLRHSVTLWTRGAGANKAMQAALACERFRMETGKWPARLEDVVPKYLDEVPIDPFDGIPIRYKVIADGILVYSIGDDLTDEGGDIGRLERKLPSSRQTDWGWVLLNPELRGRRAEEGHARAASSEPAATSQPAQPHRKTSTSN